MGKAMKPLCDICGKTVDAVTKGGVCARCASRAYTWCWCTLSCNTRLEPHDGLVIFDGCPALADHLPQAVAYSMREKPSWANVSLQWLAEVEDRMKKDG